ncbi:MAG: glycosyltransferase family 39 protein [Gemmataceae bacterium]|nr:glycosyltransferase family 39 protein [Gemmataceae bacterium]
MFSNKSAAAFDWFWFLAWALGSSAWCLSAAAEIGATFDEPFYMRAGLEGWRKGTHAPLLRMGTMPLPADVATLPLYLYEQSTGTKFDFRAGDRGTPLFWARATTLLFWWQLLFFARLVGRHFAGPWGGRLAVALIACEPNFLAHAALATTDIAAAAFLLPAAYYFAIGRDQPSWRRRIGLPAVWFGLALFAKASALAYAPLAWLLIETHRLWGRGAFALPEGAGPFTIWQRVKHGLRQYGPWWRDCWRIGPIGLVIVFLLCGSDWQTQPSFVRWAHGLPEDAAGRDTMVWLADNLKIFSNAGHGLVYQIRHNLRGHSTYLLGAMHERSLWYYYPVLLTIKLPLPLLALPVIIALLRPRALGNWACAVAAGLLIYSLNCKVQIGIRLMLPWLALGMVGLSAALVTAWRDAGGPWTRRIALGVGAASVAWLATAALSVWPHGLCYINEAWGGPERGYALVSDSNYDWGQGLRELARWQEEHEIDNLDVWYFGTDPLVRSLPVRPLQAAKMSALEFSESVRGRYLAVGMTYVYGSYAPRTSEVTRLLRGLQPVARTQTFLIYDFTNDADAIAARNCEPVSSR